MPYCITCRQLHNSPFSHPHFYSKRCEYTCMHLCTLIHTHTRIHVLPCGTACPEQIQPAGSVWGQIFWCALIFVHSRDAEKVSLSSLLWSNKQKIKLLAGNIFSCNVDIWHRLYNFCLLLNLQRHQFPSRVQVTLELHVSRDRSRSSISPQRRAARWGLTCWRTNLTPLKLF